MCPLEVRDKAMITHLQLPLPVCKLRVLNADVERQQLTDGDQLNHIQGSS